MMASSPDRLTALQRALIEAFFRHEARYFLTGGAALAGFYLHHRATLDVDLFTLDLIVRLRRAAFPGPGTIPGQPIVKK